MNIILFGAPGAGKGTQTDKLSKDFNLHKISTGDLLREEIKKNTVLGNEIKKLIDNGSFVPDKIIEGLIEKVIANKSYSNRLIFDGYPRNLSQAKDLDIFLKKSNQKISCVLILNVPQDIILKRILGRQICTKCDSIFNSFFNPPTKSNHKCDSNFLVQRSDDNEKTLKKRFDTYVKSTLPILEFYKKQKLSYEIDGKGDISDIYVKIQAIIASLET